MSNLSHYLFLLLPLIIGGVANMIWVKSSVFNGLKTPMDAGLCLSDGKRLWGDNKTWKGFIGMIVLTALAMSGVQAMVIALDGAHALSMIPFRSWSFPFSGLLFGGLWGLAYVLSELPNSYIKRRIDIDPGTNSRGLKGALFLIVDQADSIVGCALLLPLFFAATWGDAIAFIVTGTVVHLVINVLLFFVGLKKQPA